ncbi:MAG: tRNA pseudouridine(38-40) synthase TruA [Candidatus Eremiobacterota bacterium]
MKRFRALVEYNGRDFVGFQVQPDARTVQGELQRVFSQLCDAPIRLLAAGRTDTGVHATGQVVAFDTDCRRGADQFLRGGNALLPQDVRLLEVREADPHFHPRFSARCRTYRYLILHRQPDPFLRGLAWFHPEELDLQAMARAAAPLLGRHDFAAFSCGHEGPTTERTLLRLETSRTEEPPFPSPLDRLGPLTWVEVTADAFLRRMVRMLVASLASVGRGEWEPARLMEVLRSRNPGASAPPAPAGGLYLTSVDY